MQFILKTMRPALLLVILAAVAFVGCGGTSNDNDEEDFRLPTYTIGEPIDDAQVAAIVESEYGTDTLATAFFEQQYNMIVERIPQLAGDEAQQRELRRNIIEEFVRRHVVFGEADRAGINVDSTMVEAELAQVRAQFGSEEAFQDALMANALTEDSLRMSIRDDLRQQLVLQQMADEVEGPTEDEIEDFRQSQAEEVRAQHILFLTRPNMAEEEREEISRRAEAVLDSARSGNDFAELARRHSDDGSSVQGGDLGYFRRGQMVPEFEEAVFALSDSGDVTRDLVETQYGYHIIRLTDRRTGSVMDTTVARQQLEQRRRQRAVQERVRDLVETATVRVNEDVVQADLNDPLSL